MAYQKLNFQPEQILEASQLNHMENGIAEATNTAEAAKTAIDEFLGGDTEIDTSNVFLATIGTTWTENPETGARIQTVTVEGMTETMSASIDVIYTGDDTSESYEAFVEAQNQFLQYITNGYAKPVDGGIYFCIFGEPNTVEIPIVIVLI